MNKFNYAAAGALALALSAGVAQAEVSLSYGATLTSNYVYAGVTQTMDGAAVQPYVEVASDLGFYAGIWASNVDFASADNFEYDLYVGYGGSFGSVDYDVAYIGYYYDDSGFASDELALTFSYALTDTISASSSVSSYLDGTGSFTQGFTFAIADAYEIGAEITTDLEGYEDWNIGVTRAINDNVSVDLRYHQAEGLDALFTLSISIDS